MLKDAFIGKHISHFRMNPLVKAFIVSEMLVWSAYNFFNPILAIFVITRIKNGMVEFAAIGFSIYLISRVIGEIVSGKIISRYSENKRFLIIIFGLIILSISYFSLAVSETIFFLYLSFIEMGIGMGISSPARMSVFSDHIDKEKEPEEWSVMDATSLIGMALAGALGGFVANKFGFPVLFLTSAVINLLSIIPYLLFIRIKLEK